MKIIYATDIFSVSLKKTTAGKNLCNLYPSHTEAVVKFVQFTCVSDLFLMKELILPFLLQMCTRMPCDSNTNVVQTANLGVCAMSQAFRKTHPWSRSKMKPLDLCDTLPEKQVVAHGVRFARAPSGKACDFGKQQCPDGK